MKKKLYKETYATIFDVSSNGVCHFCIHYSDDHYFSMVYSGENIVAKVKQICKCNIYDITNTIKIIGLNESNMYKYGAKLIRPKIK